MKKPEMIIVSFVHDHIYYEKDGRYSVQFAGVSDKPSMLMKLQAWTMPHESRVKAIEQRDEFKKKIKKLGDIFLIISVHKNAKIV